MAKVTYHAPEGDSAVVSMGGLRFFDGQAAEVDAGAHRRLIGKLSNNQHFVVEGFAFPGHPEAEGTAPAGGRAIPGDEAQSVATPPDADGLVAIHKGFGRYIIVTGDKSHKLKDGLTKADAEAFNALSEAEKEAYVG